MYENPRDQLVEQEQRIEQLEAAVVTLTEQIASLESILNEIAQAILPEDELNDIDDVADSE